MWVEKRVIPMHDDDLTDDEFQRNDCAIKAMGSPLYKMEHEDQTRIKEALDGIETAIEAITTLWARQPGSDYDLNRQTVIGSLQTARDHLEHLLLEYVEPLFKSPVVHDDRQGNLFAVLEKK